MWIAWTLDFVQDFGVFLLVALWVVVTAVILGLTALASRLLARRRSGPHLRSPLIEGRGQTTASTDLWRVEHDRTRKGDK